MYPEKLVTPMISELTSFGFKELKNAKEVDNYFQNQKGTSLLVVNSVCGCAAGAARPGILNALDKAQKKPDNLVTVFAGFDIDATQKAREYMLPYPPSSPSICLFKDGELMHMIERHHIEGRTEEMVGDHLTKVFEEYC